MKKIILSALILVITSCCRTYIHKQYKIVEKIQTQNKSGNFIYYHFLLENGKDVEVSGKKYVEGKIGDYYTVIEIERCEK